MSVDHARRLQYAEFFAQLQSAQDLLSERLGVCIVLIDAHGNEITLPSGLPLVCNQHKESARCHAGLIAQLGSADEFLLSRCPNGLCTTVIETSIRTDDGPLYLLAGRTTEQSDVETAARLLRAIFTLPFDTPFVKRREAVPASASPQENMTPQERKVLACIVAGLTNKDIASRLCISPSTVKAHVGSLFKKLNLSNRTEASVYALKNGIHLDDAHD